MTTRKIILLTGAATLLVLALFGGKAPALAGDNISCSYTKWYGLNCTRNYTPPTAPLTRAEREAEQTALDAKVAKWEAFCKPTKTYDHDGIGRLTYAQPGCEFGRSE